VKTDARRKPKFKVGQVVAYRRVNEPLYRYARIHSHEGLLLCRDGHFRDGLRLLDGHIFYTVDADHWRPLTKRERGGQP
jgi:hypothetical protein